MCLKSPYSNATGYVIATRETFKNPYHFILEIQSDTFTILHSDSGRCGNEHNTN